MPFLETLRPWFGPRIVERRYDVRRSIVIQIRDQQVHDPTGLCGHGEWFERKSPVLLLPEHARAQLIDFQMPVAFFDAGRKKRASGQTGPLR